MGFFKEMKGGSVPKNPDPPKNLSMDQPDKKYKWVSYKKGDSSGKRILKAILQCTSVIGAGGPEIGYS